MTRDDFRRELARLRERADLTVRQIAALADATRSHSTIGDWFAGRGLPSPSSGDLLVRVLKACGVSEPAEISAWLSAWRRTRRTPGRRPRGPEPYRGLTAFQPEHAEWFFGREAMNAELIGRLDAAHQAGGGMQIVVGASGSGKSSLLRAGLIHAVRDQQLLGEGWSPVLFTPGPHPLRELATRLAVAAGAPGEHLLADLQDRPERAAVYARRADPERHRLLLVVDQFEEAFTLCDDGRERQAFVTALCSAAGPGKSLVVVGLRADFYASILRHPELVAAVRAHQLTVGPMEAAELRRAIVEPARKAGLEVEDGLVELLLNEVRRPHGAHGSPAHEDGLLPLLSHALYATWLQSRDRRLTIGDYREVGGIDRAVASTADAVFESLDERQRALARQLFLGLVHVASDTVDTRRRTTRDEILAACDGPAEQVAEVLDRFVAQRLITADTDTVQISHEALLTAWPLLRGWLETDRAGLLTRRRLDEAALTWHREGRDPAALYRGARLAVAREWVRTAGPQAALRPVTDEFLNASIGRELSDQRAARRRTRRLHQLVTGLSVLLLLAATTTFLAVRAQRDADRQRDDAVSRKLAGELGAVRIDDPALANQLSLAAYRLAPTTEARGRLLSAFATPYSIRLTGYTEYVHDAVFRPDGRVLATSSGATVRLWDTTAAHRPILLTAFTAHKDYVPALRFSADGRLLATVSADRTARLWDLADPRHPQEASVLTGHTDAVNAVAFSPAGRLLVTAGSDHTIRLWDATDPDRPVIRSRLDGGEALFSVAFSPDGRTLATGGRRTIRLWNVADPPRPRESATLKGHTDTVNRVAFSPDGATLASAGLDGTVRLWHVPDGARVSILKGHTGAVYCAAFSPDGRTLVTGGVDSTARVWDVRDPRRPTPLITLVSHVGALGDTNAVSSVAFSPDGRTLATGSYDYTVRLWDLPGPMWTGGNTAIRPMSLSPDGRRLILGIDKGGSVRAWALPDRHGPGDPIDVPIPPGRSMAFGADGRLLATTNPGTLRLWDVASPAHPAPLATLNVTGATDDLQMPVLSADGRLLAVVASRERVAHLWNVVDPRHPVALARFSMAAHGNPVNSVTLSPDERYLATAGIDHTARLWDLEDPRHPRQASVLVGHTDVVNTVAFSRDGRTVATTGNDRTVRLWDITDPSRPAALATLTGHTSFVDGVAFSPDGRTLATGGDDRTVRLWNLADLRHPTESAVLSGGHTGTVNSVTFTPDGGSLISAGADGTVRSWEVDPARVADRICSTAYPPLTRREWDQYLPGIPYRPPCPPSRAYADHS